MTYNDWETEVHKAAMAYRAASVQDAPEAFELLLAAARKPAAPKNPQDAPKVWRGDSNAALAWACGWNECLEASKPAAPALCSICNGYGRYQDGNSGTESDGYAPNIVECECTDEERRPEYRVAAPLDKGAESQPADNCKPGGCSAIGCDSGHYCFTKDVTPKPAAPSPEQDERGAFELPFETLKTLWKNGSENRDLLKGSMAYAFAMRIFEAQKARAASTSANVAQGVEAVEPTLYQYRTKPTWTGGRWCEWTNCSAEAAAGYRRVPLLHDWAYEVRELFERAAPPAQTALTDDARDAARWRRVQHQYSANEIDALTAAQSASGDTK